MSAGSKEKTRRMRREKIIDAAEKLFFTKGFERTTMDDIATEARFSKRTVYAYFTSKEQLHFEVMIRGYRLLIDMLKHEEAQSVSADSLHKLENMAMTLYVFSKNFPEYFSAIFLYENEKKDFTGIPDQSRETCYALGEEVFGMLTTLIREGQDQGQFKKTLDPVKTALVLWSCITGVFQTAKVKNEYIRNQHFTTPDELVKHALQIIVQAIHSENGGSSST